MLINKLSKKPFLRILCFLLQHNTILEGGLEFLLHIFTELWLGFTETPWLKALGGLPSCDQPLSSDRTRCLGTGYEWEVGRGCCGPGHLHKSSLTAALDGATVTPTPAAQATMVTGQVRRAPSGQRLTLSSLPSFWGRNRECWSRVAAWHTFP